MTDAALQRSGSELAVRVAAGAAMALVALVAIALGGDYFWGLAAAAAMAMAGEWAGLIDDRGARGAIMLAAMGLVLLLACPKLELPGSDAWIGLAGGAAAVCLVARAPMLAAGIVYIGASALALLYLRDQSDGAELTVWTVAVVCATDTGAYFVGRAIGGRKLAPRISPGKTWAGLFGGMGCALAVGIVLGDALRLPLRLGALGALLGALAQGGDLFESWLKRRRGVKDSGSLLPGHGGVLDRLDGLIPVAGFVAALIALGWI